MPEHIKDLTVVLVLASLVWFFASRPALAVIDSADLSRRRNAWLALTIGSFLISNFWVFALLAVALLSFAAQRDSSRVALFFSMLFVMPAASVEVPGFGVINYLIALDYLRLLSLAVLLPAWLKLALRGDAAPFGRTGPDKLLFAFLVLSTVLQLRETSFTDTMRYAFNLFVDIFLPYVVISRSLRTLHDFRAALFAFVLAALVLALVAVAETLFFHLFYRPPLVRMGLTWSFLHYLPRNGMLRAAGSTGHPIALGYVMIMAIGFFVFIKHYIASPRLRFFGMALLLAGFVAPFSRGPWIGGVVFLVVFILTGAEPFKRLAKVLIAALMAIPLLTVLPGGHAVIDLLPFIGTTEEVNVLHRENLIDAAYIVVMRNPLFGAVNYGAYPEIQALLLGGIIDIVNTYVLLALEIGLVGMGLFVGVFVLLLLNVYQGMQRLPASAGEERLLGRVLLAALLTTMVIIVTTSSITVIPVVYWSLAGMGLAYSFAAQRWATEPEAETASEVELSGQPWQATLPSSPSLAYTNTHAPRMLGALSAIRHAQRERARLP
jgi:hypothetical protein